MSPKPTVREIATTRSLWEQHIDPDNNHPQSFDTYNIEAKMVAIIEMFPGDIAPDDAEALALLARSRSL